MDIEAVVETNGRAISIKLSSYRLSIAYILTSENIYVILLNVQMGL